MSIGIQVSVRFCIVIYLIIQKHMLKTDSLITDVKLPDNLLCQLTNR